ncbi:hypothetical protein BKK56_07150 [Rodentibacter genomosp. 2]|uniref:hypothetical protein n=1 Tax=Rodentibacter genomosp. 2 TaxID=1908266 RepID=UPI0009842C4A|nr:hypothetical protein BKK56_07150 [Rodentibacter genomosp. 2]
MIIDLDHNGIQTLSDSRGVTFDFRGDGNKIQTGWVAPNDGLLVWDKNNDGIINSGEELFGENPKDPSINDGFEALSLLDSNKDLIFDKNDVMWSKLEIWKDANSDGITQIGELFSLDSIGIVSIELNAKSSEHIDSNGNLHKLISKVNWQNSQQTDITDVWFRQNKEYIGFPPDIQSDVDKLIQGMSTFNNVTTDLITPALTQTIFEYGITSLAS